MNFTKKKLNIKIDTNKNDLLTSKDVNNTKIKTTIYPEEQLLSSSREPNNEKNKNINIKNNLNSLYNENNKKFNTIEYVSNINYKDLLYKKNNNDNEKNICLSLDNKIQNCDKNNIKTLYDLNKKCRIEKNLLKGFIRPQIKERSFRKAVPKYKSTMNIYKKEWELYKLVNPIKYKLDKEKQLKELKYIQEKIEKGKDIISFGLPKTKKNKFFET